MQRFSRTWSEADINWQAKPADLVENDPDVSHGLMRPDSLLSRGVFRTDYLQPSPGQAAIAAAATALNSAWVAPSFA